MKYFANFLILLITALIFSFFCIIDSESFCNSYQTIKKVDTIYISNKCLIKVDEKEIPIFHYILLKD
jgi:hypothetical protein